jgi:hypothetical protein
MNQPPINADERRYRYPRLPAFIGGFNICFIAWRSIVGSFIAKGGIHMEAMIVRPAEESDLVQLADIYNHYVRTSSATFDIEPVSLANRREWFGHYHASGPHRFEKELALH